MRFSDGAGRYRPYSLIGLFLLLFLSSRSPAVDASWLYLGLVSSLGASVHRDTCGLVPGLVYEQVELCKNSPDTITCVGEGVRRGIYECQSQFRFERWNCTTTPNQSVFGPVLNNGTKESAFIRAVTSAGVAHAVTQSCSAGNLTDCSCDLSREGLTHKDGWKWGGCSDNIEYGIWFSRTFVDAPDAVRVSQAGKKGDIHSLVNLHNNEAGRQTIRDVMRLKCRCHGVSGSCAVKSCWKKMPTFREVGSALKKQYELPVEVAPRSTRNLRRRDKPTRRVPIKEKELVYVEQSPNYCQADPDTGVLGTTGRECKLDSSGPDSCDTLCCGRGYNTFVDKHTERCFCKFIWCCYVKCKLCETVTDRHICK